MSIRKDPQAGFTLVELMVSIALVAVVSMIFTTLFISTFKNYLSIQKDGTAMTQLAAQANRVATVVRGVTDIVSADANDLVIYAYFYPSDAYVSEVHYYVANGQLLADVTPMTANPPTGTLETDKARTYTIIDNYYQAAGTNLFTYLNSVNTTLATPLTDTAPVSSVQITLAVPQADNGSQTLQVLVSLRNRKTNL